MTVDELRKELEDFEGHLNVLVMYPKRKGVPMAHGNIFSIEVIMSGPVIIAVD